MERVRTIKIQENEEIGSYFNRHKQLRQEMVRAQCPGSERESMTVAAIIRGLRSSKRLAQYIPILLLQRPNTIVEFQNQIGAVNMSLPTEQPKEINQEQQKPAPYCHYHEAYGHHTSQCWTLLEFKRRGYENKRNRGRPYRQMRGRGRGRVKREAPARRANQIDEQEEEDDEDSYQDYAAYNEEQHAHRSTTDDQIKDDPIFEYYILDSGYNPSYKRDYKNRMARRSSSVIMPDGTRVPTRAEKAATYIPDKQETIKIPRLVRAPAFRQNLLSVQKLTKYN